MRTIGFSLEAMVAVLFLLCMFTSQHAAAFDLQAVQNTIPSQQDVGAASLLSQPPQRVSDGAVAMVPKVDDTASGAIPLPPQEKIVESASNLVKAADESLDAAAHESNVAGKIADFRNTFHNVISASTEISGYMSELTQQGFTLEQISDELGVIFGGIPERLKKAFPSPDQAPSHEERQKMVGGVLDEAERGLLDFGRERGMSDDHVESLRRSFNRLKPHVEKLVSITGDLREQYPVLSSTLIFTGVGMFIPEWVIVRPLLGVIGFGPFGPVKGTAAAWIQRLIWGGAIPKGGLFALLQKAGMTATASGPIRGVVGGAIGGTVRSAFGWLSGAGGWHQESKKDQKDQKDQKEEL